MLQPPFLSDAPQQQQQSAKSGANEAVDHFMTDGKERMERVKERIRMELEYPPEYYHVIKFMGPVEHGFPQACREPCIAHLGYASTAAKANKMAQRLHKKDNRWTYYVVPQDRFFVFPPKPMPEQVETEGEGKDPFWNIPVDVEEYLDMYIEEFQRQADEIQEKKRRAREAAEAAKNGTEQGTEEGKEAEQEAEVDPNADAGKLKVVDREFDPESGKVDVVLDHRMKENKEFSKVEKKPVEERYREAREQDITTLKANPYTITTCVYPYSKYTPEKESSFLLRIEQCISKPNDNELSTEIYNARYHELFHVGVMQDECFHPLPIRLMNTQRLHADDLTSPFAEAHKYYLNAKSCGAVSNAIA